MNNRPIDVESTELWSASECILDLQKQFGIVLALYLRLSYRPNTPLVWMWVRPEDEWLYADCDWSCKLGKGSIMVTGCVA